MGTWGSCLDCDWRPFGYPKALFLQSTLLCHQKEWRLSPDPGPITPRFFLFDTSASREGIISPLQFSGDGNFSCDKDFSVCQLMPSFPKVFLFSPIWEEYLSRRPYAPLKQSVLPSGSHSDDLSFPGQNRPSSLQQLLFCERI